MTTIYLVCLYGADYAYRNRPEMYRFRKLLGASTRKKNAEAFAEVQRNSLGGVDMENHEIRIDRTGNL